MSVFEHPVYRAERDHQWAVMQNSRSSWLWVVLALVMLLPALLMALYLFFSVMVWGGSVIVLPQQTISPIMQNLQLLMVVMNVALYFVIALVSCALANASIEREKHGSTWDLLRLTGISGRDLVWSKWLASLRVMRTDYLLLALLRVGWAVWFAAGFRAQFPSGALPASTAVALLVLLALAFTLIDAAFNTALSIAIALADITRGIGTIGLAVRGMALLLTVWVWGQIIARLFDSPGAVFLWHGLFYLVIYAALMLAVVWLAQRLAFSAGYVDELA